MTKLFRYLVLIIGVLSPFLAQYLYSLVYTTLTQASSNREKDWLFRLCMSALAMTVPFFITVLFAWLGRRQQGQQQAISRADKRRQQRSTFAALEAVPNAMPWEW